jgi:RNA polymerase sigma-70 factor (ECF subfamily)
VTLPEAAEAELVRRAVDGDGEATGALLALIRPGVVRYCRASLGPVAGAYTTADDVSQDVCIAVLKALPRYRDLGRPFSAFVYTIAGRRVADAQRAAVRSHTAPSDTLPDRAEGGPGPEQRAVSTDLARRLSRLLGHLPPAQREIIVLRVAVGLSAEEAGEVLGMSAGAVRVAQSRALAHLRKLAPVLLDEVRT